MSVLTGKTALVTGASRGIGRAIAERLAADGALVVVHYGSNHAAAKDTVASIEKDGGQAFAVQAELGVPGGVQVLMSGLEAGLERLTGSTGLDIVVNNAAIDIHGEIGQITPEDFDRLFAVNVKAPFFIVQQALGLLREGGRIVNISSANSTRIAMGSEIAYSMSKGALNTMASPLANRVGARGITVNTVTVGPTETDMNPWMRDNAQLKEMTAAANAIPRVGRPTDIAAAVAFLASPDGGWITGHTLDATGGCFLGPRI